MSSLRQSYGCAALSERLQALVAELRDVEKLRSKLRRAEARSIGRGRRAKPGSRAGAVSYPAARPAVYSGTERSRRFAFDVAP